MEREGHTHTVCIYDRRPLDPRPTHPISPCFPSATHALYASSRSAGCGVVTPTRANPRDSALAWRPARTSAHPPVRVCVVMMD